MQYDKRDGRCRRLGRAAGALLVAALLVSPTAAPAAAQDPDALHTRVRAELARFTAWLERNDAKGYIGEVGWPDDPNDAGRWNALADAWFRDADRAGLWVTTWATGEWWGAGYRLAQFEDRNPGGGVDSDNSQAPVLMSHSPPKGYRRGINVAGGEFAAPATHPTSDFSNENPGAYDRSYHYDPQETFDFLASRGVRLVRIPFRWERLQPQPGGPLDVAELQRLKDAATRARTAGMKVILDMHNYGAYYLSDGTQGVRRAIGSPEVSAADFADVWRRISRRFRRHSGVKGYGLMNEPVDLPARPDRSAAEVWERASQRALRAIRRTGDRKFVLVPGYFWSGAQRWPDVHPDAWIRDPLDRFRYEAHHYWDRDNSGGYHHSYAEEVEDAEQGFAASGRLVLLIGGGAVVVGPAVALITARIRRRAK